MRAIEGHALGYAWAFAASLANASQDNLRKLASNRVKQPIEIVALSEVFNVVALACAVGASGKWGKFARYARRGDLVALAAAAGWLKALSAALLQRALRLTPLSLCVPYLAFTPLWLLVISFFLVHETPTLRGVLGVMVITVGAYMLNANSAAPEKLEKSPRLEEGLVRGGGGSSGRVRSARESLESLATPPTNGAGWMSIAFSEAAASSFREERYGVRLGCVGRSVARQVTTLRANPGSLITLGIAAVYALVADLDKLGKLHSDDLLVFIFLQRCFLLAPPLTYVMVKNPAAFNVFTKTKKVGCALALIGFLDIASMYAFLQSLNYIFTSYAVAAKRTSILASVVGGALFFKEPIARRLPYIFIMFIGMALILLADADKH